MNQENVPALLLRVEALISELKVDISQADTFGGEEIGRAVYCVEQANTSYTKAMRLILAGDDEKGVADLESLVDLLSKQQVSLLNAAILQVTTTVKQIVEKPLWIGDPETFLRPLNETQKKHASLNSVCGVSAESDSRTELRQLLTEAIDLLGRLDIFTRKAKYRLPFQILVWGSPILSGLVISGRFTTLQDLLFFIALVVFAMVSGCIQSRMIGKTADRRRSILATLLEGTGLPSELSLLAMSVIVVGLIFFLLTILAGHLVTQPMRLKFSQAPTAEGYRRGGEFDLEYTVAYSGAGPAFDVSCDIKAPGFSVLAKPQTIPAVAGIEVPLSFRISIPELIPVGTYTLEVICLYKLGERNFWEKLAPYDPFTTLVLLEKYVVTKTVDIRVN
jgi:hypothetical protein